jgi:hypothetical protein
VLHFLKNLRRKANEPQSFTFSKPLVALHSDDWGRVGVRDREGFNWLRSRGLRLGERPYDLYTLETAEDVTAVTDLLRRHHDAVGRHPCMTVNVSTANLDFNKMRGEDFKRTILLPLIAGLPGSWSRPGLFEAYRAGIDKGVLQPGLHGTTHFCETAVSKVLTKGGARAELLKILWEAETPYIFWRMPWIGYEYWSPDGSRGSFISAERQRELVNHSCQGFEQFFGFRPLSACAPGYRANSDTHRAWGAAGIHVAASGTGDGLRAPRMDEFGVLHLYRNVDFEPSQHELDVEKYLELAGLCFVRGIPLIISIHSINFHSTLKDFRSPSLAALDRLLTALESKYPELLYVNDEDLYRMVTAGVLADAPSKVKVSINPRAWSPGIAQIGPA